MKKGFTLIELAIVVIIIGILVAGTLAGQELIKQAKLRNLLQQIKEYDTAVGTFKTKYGPNALPGDFAQAHAFGLDTSEDGIVNVSGNSNAKFDGDGDNQLEFASEDPNSFGGAGKFASELLNFWVHLSNSQLISARYSAVPAECIGVDCDSHAGISYPSSKIGEGLIALTSRSRNIFYILGTSSNLIWNDRIEGQAQGPIGDHLTTDEAYAIDNKLDDGKPDSGNSVVIEAITYVLYTEPVIDTTLASDDCFSVSGGDYNLTVQEKVCTITVRASF